MTAADAEELLKKAVPEAPEEVRMDVPRLTVPGATGAPVNPVYAVLTPIVAQQPGTRPV